MKYRRSDVTIAKIDFTANDVDVKGATITGYPTVLLFPKGRKDRPLVYSGERALLALVDFIESNTEPDNSIRREEL